MLAKTTSYTRIAGPEGSPPGGKWEMEYYIGPTTIVVAIMTLGKF